MTSKINVSLIVVDHFSTFKDESTGKYSVYDFFVVFFLPAMVSVCLGFVGFNIKDEYIGTLISAFAIFSGLLFNVLVLIYSVRDDRAEVDCVRERLVNQTFANVSFSVMTCLLAVVLLSILLFVQGLSQVVLEVLIYFIGINFMLTMLMILKRMHVLMRG
jgi:hypothetical protein